MTKKNLKIVKMLTEYKADNMNKYDIKFYKEDLESALKYL